MTDPNYEAEVVRKCYRDLLNREPDEEGLNHFSGLLKKNELDEKQLIDILKNSTEYKLSNPIEIDSNTSTDSRMKKEWDARAKMDPLLAIATGHSQSEDDFWKSGVDECKNLLGIEGDLFSTIIKNKEPSKMKILEIGCGIGRILIPMSKIFGEAIGVDVSSEMVQLGQKHIANLPNCKILENNGVDLSLFTDNYFDFCCSYIVFQHIPEKKIVEQYISEVSRVLKPKGLFRFQVRGSIDTKPKKITTWDGVQFNSEEMHKIAEKNNFQIIEESDFMQEYYWLTFQSKK